MTNFTTRKFYFLLFMLVAGSGLVQAQTPSDAIMMKQREACIAVIYDHGAWDEYWEGTLLRSNETVATVNRNMVLPMIAIGLHDKVNLIISTPYVQTHSSEPNGGKFQGAKGFQDIGLVLKGEIMNKQIGQGKLAVLAALGFATPMTNYLSDYRPYSIGSGTDELSLRGIVQYQFDNGIYARTSLAFVKRGQTKAERDYYYNNGSYYTALMDVPDAWDYNVVVGKWFFDSSFKVEFNYVGMKSTSGDDIRPYNAGQPTNKVNIDQVGIAAQYYFKNIKGLGLYGHFNQIVNGRNMGKFTNIGGGVTYQFKI